MLLQVHAENSFHHSGMYLMEVTDACLNFAKTLMLGVVFDCFFFYFV